MTDSSRVIVSKHVLTKGLYEIDAQEPQGSGYMYEVGDRYNNGLKIGKDVHFTWKEAIEEGLLKKQAKIASLEKQLARLKALELKKPN